MSQGTMRSADEPRTAPPRSWPWLVFAAVCVVASVVLWWIKPGYAPGVQHLLTHAAFAVFGLAVGSAINGCAPPATLKAHRIVGRLVIPVGAALVAAFAYSCGMRQFGGFDQSVLVDVGWRLHQGQRPYVDFPCTLPVGFCIGATLAYALFGVSWHALILFNALWSALAWIWTAGLLRRLYPEQPTLALLLASALQAMALLTASYWWYNTATLSVAILYVLSAVDLFSRPRSNFARAGYCAALVLLSLLKPNVAALLIVPVTCLLALGRDRFVFVLAVSALGAALSTCVILLLGISPVDVITGYLSVAGRGVTLGQFFHDASRSDVVVALASFALIILPVLARLVRLAPSTAAVTLQIIGVVSLFVSAVAFLANGELKLVDLSLMLLGSALLVSNRVATSDGNVGFHLRLDGWVARYLIAAAGVFLFGSLGHGITRDRVRGIGYGLFFEFDVHPQRISGGFFDGLSAPLAFHRVVREVESAAAERPGPIYFGPRMQWGYAATRHASPPRQPLWWHPGISYKLELEMEYLQRWSNSRFNRLIFLKNDRTFFAPSFLSLISEHYVPVGESTSLDVFDRAVAR